MMFSYVFKPLIALNSLILIGLMIYFFLKDEIVAIQRFDRCFLKWPGVDRDHFIDSHDPTYEKEYKKNKKFIESDITSNLYIKFFIHIKAIFLAFFLFFSWYIFVKSESISIGIQTKYFLVLIFGVIGFFIPDLDLNLRRTKRINAFEKNMPTLLNMFLVCLDSGLTFKMSIFQISKELVRSHPIIAKELDRTYKNLDFLSDQRTALFSLADRVPSAQLKRLIIVVLQSIQQGSSLRDSLAHIADSASQETLFNLEKSAQNIPNILTATMVIFTLPILFIALFAPYYENFKGILAR